MSCIFNGNQCKYDSVKSLYSSFRSKSITRFARKWHNNFSEFFKISISNEIYVTKFSLRQHRIEIVDLFMCYVFELRRCVFSVYRLSSILNVFFIFYSHLNCHSLYDWQNHWRIHVYVIDDLFFERKIHHVIQKVILISKKGIYVSQDGCY